MYAGEYMSRLSFAADTCILSIDLGPDKELCSGDSLVLISPIIADTLRLIWSTGDTTSSIQVYDSGIYILTVNSNACEGSDTIEIDFHPKPIASIASDTVCVGIPTTFYNYSEALQEASFLWDFGDGNASTSRDTILEHTYSDQAYYYTLRFWVDNLNGCSDSITIGVLLNPLPSVSSSGAGMFYCAGDSLVTLTGSPAGGLFTGLNVQDNPFISDGIGFFNPGIPGDSINVIYTYQDALGCVSRDTQIVIAVFPLPSVSFSGLDATYCLGAAADTLSANVSGGVFSGPNLSTVPGTAGSNAIFHPTQVGGYPITLEYTDMNGCTNFYSGSTTVHPLPVIDLGADTILLPGQTLVLSGGVSPEYGYLWSNGATTPTLNISNPGFYTLTISFLSTGCRVSDTIFVDIGSSTISTLFPMEEINVFPNPASTMFSVYITPAFSGDLPIWMRKITGETIESRILNASEGVPILSYWEANRLPAGIYLLQVGDTSIRVMKY